MGGAQGGVVTSNKNFFFFFLGYFCILFIVLQTYVKSCNVFQKYSCLCIFMQFVVVLTVVDFCLHIYSIDIVLSVITFFEGVSFI